MSEPNETNKQGFLASQSGALTADWVVIGVCLVGLIGSTIFTVTGSQDSADGNATGLARAAVGNVACVVSGLVGSPCAVHAERVMDQRRWQNWCSRPNGPVCNFTQSQVAMSDGSVWTAIEVAAPSGVRQVFWRDGVGNRVDAPRAS